MFGASGVKALKKAKAYALNDDDIRKALGDVKIFNYPDLKKLSNIDQMFDSQGRAVLLYPNNGPMSGHWTCLINRPSRIEVFDSYGEPPEEPKDGVPVEELREWGADQPDLTNLLRGGKKPVFYNTHQFQQGKPDVATCGRWCITRLLYAPFSLKRFANIIAKSKLTGDEFVTGVVFDKIGK